MIYKANVTLALLDRKDCTGGFAKDIYWAFNPTFRDQLASDKLYSETRVGKGSDDIARLTDIMTDSERAQELREDMSHKSEEAQIFIHLFTRLKLYTFGNTYEEFIAKRNDFFDVNEHLDDIKGMFSTLHQLKKAKRLLFPKF